VSKLKDGRLPLDGNDWTLTGWYSNQWHMSRSMELNLSLLPVVPAVAASVPGDIQQDLLRAGIVSDPNIGLNSRDNEWVNNREWVLEKRFAVDEACLGQRCELVFEGIDYAGEIYLNGERLASFEGMFKPARIDVSGRLRGKGEHTGHSGRHGRSAGAEDSDGGESARPNLLQVFIARTPEVDGQVGYSSRIRTLKSRYNYAWDWCPRIVSSGIWRSVYLAAHGDVSIADFYPQAVPAQEGGPRERAATLTCSAQLDVRQPGEYTLAARVYGPEGEAIAERRTAAELGYGLAKLEQHLELASASLWWPAGYGEQPLYEVKLSVYDASGQLCAESERKVGFRTITWEQNEGAPAGALPYTIVVNGKRIFMRGVNWVPITPFHGAITGQQYGHQLGQLREMNANLVRVWGGAIIEKPEFYAACDRLGLLVWQELLQSSSGIDNTPPDDPMLLAELEEVARLAVIEKRSHPSLAIWCGGNELMMEGFVPIDERHSNIRMLKRVVEELDSGRRFLPASASGPTFTAEFGNFGKGLHHDVHGPWLYLGEGTHYDYYNQDDALIRTETGTPGILQAQRMRRLAGQHQPWPPTASNPLWLHRGAWWIQWEQLGSLFGPWDEKQDELEGYALASRYIQAESLRYAIESVRRREPESSGFLIWMGNEPYPNFANTSVLEYGGIPKPAYYAVQRAFSPLFLSAKYGKLGYRSGETFVAEVFLHNEHLAAGDYKVSVRLIGLGGDVLHEAGAEVAQADAAAGVHQVCRVQAAMPSVQSNAFLLRLELERDGLAIPGAGNTYLFTVDADYPLAPLRELRGTQVELRSRDAHTLVVRNTGEEAAIGVWLTHTGEGDAAAFYPNHLVLAPGEEVLVACSAEMSAGDVQLEGFNIKAECG
jgi:beta-mannosidase